MITKPFKLNNIIVAIDFTKFAEPVIQKALTLAKQHNASLTMIHVVENNLVDKFMAYFQPKGSIYSAKKFAIDLLKAKQKQLMKHYSKIETHVLQGNKPAFKIMQYIKKQPCDLLVIGAHSKHLLRDAVMGTTAEYIAKRTVHPLLIVKTMKTYSKILIGVDFSKVSKRAFKSALHLFPTSQFYLTHIGDHIFNDFLETLQLNHHISNKKIKQVKDAFYGYLEGKMQHFIRGYKKINIKNIDIELGYPGPILLEELQKRKCDLVVIGTKGHGNRHYLFVGSVASFIITESPIDVLLIPPKVKR